MESNTSFIFGDFNEKERKLYFSKESIKCSAIQFPDDVLAFVDEHVSFDDIDPSSPPVEERNDGFSKENESSYVNECFPDEMGTDSSKQPVDETAWEASNQVSDRYEVKAIVELANEPNSNSTAEMPVEKVSIQNEKNQSLQKDSLKMNNSMEEESPSSFVSDQKVPEKAPENANHVITVGTKTMSTTSTRTVESGIATSKSSWADLFKPKTSSRQQGPPATRNSSSLQQPTPAELLDDGTLPRKDQFQHYFMDVLKKAKLTNQVPHLQPRGLKNNGNWCYINSTLQVLIFCPSFYHFLMEFKLKSDRGYSSTPILDALVLFAGQFSSVPRQDGSKQDVVMGIPFEPTYIYNLLTYAKTSLSQQGKQEDAEEFLSCILNGMHEEIVKLGNMEEKPQPNVTTNHSGIPAESGAKESLGEWEQVGPRNKSTVTRKSTMAKSPVAEIFGGYLRSSLMQSGVKESASIQPFFSIQLDLRGEVTTVQQAFNNFFRVEEVEGFQCDKSKMEIEVSKKWTLDTLPIVLILHLKRFVVSKHGCEKLTKKISYEPELHIPQDTLSKVIKTRNRNILTYKLFAITYHHGKNLHGGHYTSDINHPTIGWLRADDMSVRTIPSKFVFNPLSNRDPYLLYYKRGDLNT